MYPHFQFSKYALKCQRPTAKSLRGDVPPGV